MTSTRLFLLAFLWAALGLAGKPAHARPLEACARELEPVPSRVETNTYTYDRVLDEYHAALRWQNYNLIMALRALRQGAIWVDGGSGRHIALIKGLEKNPQIGLGVGINAVNPEFILGDARVPGRLMSLEGYLSVLRREGKLAFLIGRVDLITDVSSIFSYDLDVRAVMQTYLDLLAVNGEALLGFQISTAEGENLITAEENTRYYNGVLREGLWDPLGLVTWLKTIPGTRVESAIHKEVHYSANGVMVERLASVRVVKLENSIVVPDTLEIHGHLQTAPYTRFYKPKKPGLFPSR